MSTKIEWSDETWNPVVGCERCSPGCDRCYAIRVAAREMQPAHVGLTKGGRNARVKWFDGETQDYTREGRADFGPLDWTGEVRLFPDRLEEPLHWRKPRRCFVCSMSDLFHPDVPEDFIHRVWNTMAIAETHTFQVLTKRPKRMASVLSGTQVPGYLHDHTPPANVWVGTSVENQRYADMRIADLLDTPAAVRFLSVEPLLGPIDLWSWLGGSDGLVRDEDRDRASSHAYRDRALSRAATDPPQDGLLRRGDADPVDHGESRDGRHEAAREGIRLGVTPSIDWVIVGGESGPGARPMELEWAESIVEQCKASGVAVFVKQLGTVAGGKHHHDIDTFPESLRVREFPT